VNRPTEAGNFATEAQVITKKRQEWLAAYETRRGTKTYKSMTNATDTELLADADVAGLSNATENSLSGAHNAAGLNDYTLTKAPYEGASGSGDAWDNFEHSTTFTVYEKRRIRGIWKYRVETITYEIKQCRSHHTAYDFIATDDDLDHKGTHVEVLGKGEFFRAIKLTHDYASTWTQDEP
jgi:hypothetical protein